MHDMMEIGHVSCSGCGFSNQVSSLTSTWSRTQIPYVQVSSEDEIGEQMYHFKTNQNAAFYAGLASCMHNWRSKPPV